MHLWQQGEPGGGSTACPTSGLPALHASCCKINPLETKKKAKVWAAALYWCLSQLQAFLHLPAETRADESVYGERAPCAAGVSRWEAQRDHLFLRNVPLTCPALLAEMILAGPSLSCVKQAQVTKWHNGRQFLLQGDVQLFRRGHCSAAATQSQSVWNESALLLPANSSPL